MFHFETLLSKDWALRRARMFADGAKTHGTHFAILGSVRTEQSQEEIKKNYLNALKQADIAYLNSGCAPAAQGTCNAAYRKANAELRKALGNDRNAVEAVKAVAFPNGRRVQTRR